jgi:hypothetical protein
MMKSQTGATSMRLASISGSHVLPSFLNHASPEECDTLDSLAPDINDMSDELGADRIYIEKPITTWGGIRVPIVRFKAKGGKVLKTKTFGALLPQ